MRKAEAEISIIGILADTHDHAANMIAAVALLKERGAQYLIHCGDLCEPGMLDHLVGLPAAFVWGNNDDRYALQSYAAIRAITCCREAGDLTLGGKRIAVLHGDDAALAQRLIAGQQHDYIFQGHSHRTEDRRVGRTRLINPGALQRAGVKTCALLNLQTDALEFLVVAPPR